MKKITSCSVVALGLSLITGATFADTGTGAAATPSSNPQPSSYSLIPYISLSTSPYAGLGTAYDASDVWSQQSTMNEDLTILKYKQSLQNRLQQVGASLDQRPIVEISGAVAGTATETFSNSQYNGNFSLSTTELDINAMAGKWATGFMSLGYNSSNSDIFVSRGFVTIGNLDKTPFYLTAGQLYLPFGRYSSGLNTAPLTLSLARIKDQAVILGYSKNNLSMQGYAYPGIDADSNGSIFHAAGFNANYKMVFNPDLNLNVGSGVISDMTDAQGMRSTGASAPQFPGFTSFSGSSSSYPFTHTVPGADIHSEFNFWTNTFAGEFIGATRQFDAQDLSYNGAGAQPEAMHLELSHSFKIQDHPSTAGVAYGRSWQALGLNLPQSSYMAYFYTSIWKNTIAEIEFRHDENYASNDVATAVSNPNANNTSGPFINTGTGKGSDMVTLQLGVYF